MEIIEIQSAYSLITSITERRSEGAHSYKLNCRQYVSTYHDWQKHHQTPSEAFGVMTLEFQRIWITEAEGKQLATAIQAAHSPVVLG